MNLVSFGRPWSEISPFCCSFPVYFVSDGLRGALGDGYPAVWVEGGRRGGGALVGVPLRLGVGSKPRPSRCMLKLPFTLQNGRCPFQMNYYDVMDINNALADFVVTKSL